MEKNQLEIDNKKLKIEMSQIKSILNLKARKIKELKEQ